jgi:RNA-directed DNA polymerase
MSVVLMKPANEERGAPRPKEPVEGRGMTKRNSERSNRCRTQSRESLENALFRIRQKAQKEKTCQFTTLWHHVCEIERLRSSYYELKRNAAPGIDGETWDDYGEKLEINLQRLSISLKTGAYNPKPVKRVHIPKADGRKRPIGITSIEDKIAQRSLVQVLEAVYETDFKGFSYGFRPGKSAHNALDAVWMGIHTKKIGWVLDADIRSFFDTISGEWMVKFLQHRIADKRIIRYVKKWMQCGVFEEGVLKESLNGVPQGGSLSPFLANAYLHYVLDLWVEAWRKQVAKGDVIIVRYADDFVVGFQHKAEALQFQQEIRIRFRKFALEIADEKTKLIEFGRFANSDLGKRNAGKPQIFNFLGFTHICGVSPAKKKFLVIRLTEKKRMRRKLKEIRHTLMCRRHDPVPEVGAWLEKVVTGHYNYFGVPGNTTSLGIFRHEIGRSWHYALLRRSQLRRRTWDKTQRLCKIWLPIPQIKQPFPSERLRVHNSK